MSYQHYRTECGEHHDLVRDYGAGAPVTKPRIVCLCGSTRFADEFRRQNCLLTCEGQIVLTIGCNTKNDDDRSVAGAKLDKAALDELHRRKIDVADYVLVLNVGGYIGASTRSEIAYAQQIGRGVEYVEEW